jgi:hypothetical protein
MPRRMSRLAALPFGLVVLVVAACDGGAASSSTPPTYPLPPPAPTSPQTEAELVPSASSTPVEPAPLDIIVGRLHLTKGAQPLVDGQLIASEDFEKRFGADWRKLLVDRRVRVTGRKYVHACEPQEQCLTGGEIPQIRGVRAIEVCATLSLAPSALPETVPCPAGEAELATCKAECDAQSRLCDEASRASQGPGLRRCGCARVTCFQACAESAEALFMCR